MDCMAPRTSGGLIMSIEKEYVKHEDFYTQIEKISAREWRGVKY